LNRETRDGLSVYEKDYLHEAFQYTGGGLLLTALGARGLFQSGAAVRIMSANPCKYPALSIPIEISNYIALGLVLGVSLVYGRMYLSCCYNDIHMLCVGEVSEQ
jgi:hypothetical protein